MEDPARLAALEGAGLVRSEPYSERPLRVSYALTDAGRELRTAIEALAVTTATRGKRAAG